MQSAKIVVTGPFGSGKTSLIKAISEITVLSTDRTVGDVSGENGGETTVAMDFGRITISEDIVLYLFGTPGHERFSFMWETLSEGMLGIILLADGDDPQSIQEAKSILEFLSEIADVPYVVAANKVNAEDDGALEYVRSTLELDAAIPLFPVDSTDRESVKSVLLGLLHHVFESLS